MAREQRRLAAILAADVAGYSRLTGADEEGTLKRLRALRAELIDPAIQSNRGRIVKTTGDGILVEFASVVDAARCAVETQRAMANRNADFLAERQIQFRVGIHLGDVVVEADGDLMGDGVNIAARLEGIAEPGGICLSEDAWRQVRDRLDAAFADLGERALKNIARPIRVYSINPSPPFREERSGEVGDFRALDTTSPSRAVGAGPSLSATRRGNDAAPRLSIVVLPFANIGGDPEQEYFVDGVTESLTTDLSRISGSFVIARNTAFTYKGKPVDVKQIGRDLGVRHVLEGSVQRGGNRMRVNVQLIDAETGNHLWAERFDKPVADLFDMQDEIVSRLANQLGTQMLEAEARRAETSPDPDSMDLYFLGRASLNKVLTPETAAQARSFFERALELSPGNVEALIGLGYVDAVFGGPFFSGDRAQRLAAAEKTLNLALSKAPEHPLAHVHLGLVQIHTGRAVLGIAECERALVLDRNLAVAHGYVGLGKIVIGRGSETETHINEALRLSPRDTNAVAWLTMAGLAKLHIGADEEATVWCRRAIETNRAFPPPHFWLAASLAQLGRIDEANAAAVTGLTFNPGFTINRFRGGLVNDNPIYLAQRERVYDGLRKAGVPEG